MTTRAYPHTNRSTRHRLPAFAALGALTLSLLAAPTAAFAADPAPVMHDTMQRSVATGWGQAPNGGAYEVSAGAPASVQPGAATIAAAGPGRTAAVVWQGETPRDAQTSTVVSLPSLPEGGSGAYLSTHARQPTSGSYAARLRVLPDGRTELALVRQDGWDATILSQRAVELGDAVHKGTRVELRVEGADPVRLHARAYAAGQPAPAWQLEQADASAKRIPAAGKAAWSTFNSSQGNIVPAHFAEVSVLNALPLDAEVPELPETPPLPPAEKRVVHDSMSRNFASGWGEAEIYDAFGALYQR